jgi:3-deoxy-manno-octulosonate cytidylyltransferase (CMP-KDO synthetase)
MSRAVGVIPSRWASTRLPGKSLVSICGKPLVQWVVERAALAQELAEVLVATDDRRIADAVEAVGARAVMTAPDHPSGTDRIAEAVTGIEADIVVNIQGDEPLVDPGLLDELVRVMRGDPTWDMGTAATPITDPADLAKPSVVKVVTDDSGKALYFSRAAIPYDRDGEGALVPGLHRRHIGIYAYRRAFLERLVQAPPSALEAVEKLEQLRALGLGARLVVLDTQETGIGVDTPEDVAYVEAIIREREGLPVPEENP